MVSPEYIASVTTRSGNLFCFKNDLRVGRSLLEYGEWGESELILLRQLIRPADVVVDVGAFIGTHCVEFARIVGGDGQVYAVEPLAEAAELLTANCRSRSLTNVSIHRQALGATAAPVSCPKLSVDTSGDYSAFAAKGTSGTVSGSSVVQMVPLDSFEIPRCRLVKLDVEGVEYDVLQGGQEFLKRTRPIVFVEANDEASTPLLIELLRSLHFRLYWHLDFLFHRPTFTGRDKDVFSGSFDVNILALPEELEANVVNFEAVAGPTDSWKQALERSRAAKR